MAWAHNKKLHPATADTHPSPTPMDQTYNTITLLNKPPGHEPPSTLQTATTSSTPYNQTHSTAKGVWTTQVAHPFFLHLTSTSGASPEV